MSVPLVDIHTHVYPPKYISLLKARSSVPYIRRFEDTKDDEDDRLIILPGEDAPGMASTSRGRPVGRGFWDIKEKLSFMDKHHIRCSVISLANPWLDFLPPGEAGQAARDINDDINKLCVDNPTRLRAFGTLPLSAPVAQIVDEIHRLKTLEHMRGIIMGTHGIGAGLDDPELDPIWHALSITKTVVFLHPHYGLSNDLYGPRASDYGHILPLAIGFPVETTIAITRMILSRVFDRFEGLQVLLAHSGGTLPFLAGRIESCVAHDAHYQKNSQARRSIWEVLTKNVFLDAVVYSKVGLQAAIAASGKDKLMFGTDHPFFPPPDKDDSKEWLSVSTNVTAIQECFGEDGVGIREVAFNNASRILDLRIAEDEPAK